MRVWLEGESTGTRSTLSPSSTGVDAKLPFSMADGGQRLLDVIDDPNALESFLGGLTADSELLPSEAVDNVVASLARSLEAGDYEVDSPNDNLFDSFEPTSNNLTGISQSYVSSDFGVVGALSAVDAQNNAHIFNNLAPPGIPNGSNQDVHPGEHQIQTADCINSTVPMAPSAENLFVTVSQSHNSGRQLDLTEGGCENGANIFSSLTTEAPVEASSQVFISDSSSLTNDKPLITSSEALTQPSYDSDKNHIGSSASEHVSSFHSNTSVISNVASNTESMISTSASQTHTNATSIKAEVASVTEVAKPATTVVNLPSVPSINFKSSQSDVHQGSKSTTAASAALTTVHSSITSLKPEAATKVAEQVFVSSSSIDVDGKYKVSTASTTAVTPSIPKISESPSVTYNNQQSSTTFNQTLTPQSISIPGVGVSVSGTNAQILSSSQNALVAANQGQNIMIQNPSQTQNFISVEQPTTALIATGVAPTAFGANLALVTTGGAPTYAVLPSGPQFISNGIVAQSQSFTNLARAPNGTYYQTTPGPVVAAPQTSTQNSVPPASPASTKPKVPPQLLPKPKSSEGQAPTSTMPSPSNSDVASASAEPVQNTNSLEANSSAIVNENGSTIHNNASRQASNVLMRPNVASNAVKRTPEVAVNNMISAQQQHQNQIVTSVGTGVTLAVSQPQAYTIGNPNGLGQVVVPQVSGINSLSNTQQTQIAGTLIVNQFGQPVLVPTASTGQQNAGVQFIVRQQPAQPQVLAIQTPTGTATIGAQNVGKPIVRYVSQQPGVPAGYGLQQIQTQNGPAWVAVRYPQNTALPSQNAPVAQIDNNVIQSHLTASQKPLQLQSAVAIHNQVQSQNQTVFQQTESSVQTGQNQTLQTRIHNSSNHVPQTTAAQVQHITTQTQSPSPKPISPVQAETPKAKKSHASPSKRTNTNDNSSDAPPAKKSKSKSNKSKNKVTLDLEQLLKQSGIMDEDLQDDCSFDFSFGYIPDPQERMDSISESIDSAVNSVGTSMEKQNGVFSPTIDFDSSSNEMKPKSKKKKSAKNNSLFLNSMLSNEDEFKDEDLKASSSLKSNKKKKSIGIGSGSQEKDKHDRFNHSLNETIDSVINNTATQVSCPKHNIPKKTTTGDELMAIIEAVAISGRSPSPPSMRMKQNDCLSKTKKKVVGKKELGKEEMNKIPVLNSLPHSSAKKISTKKDTPKNACKMNKISNSPAPHAPSTLSSSSNISNVPVSSVTATKSAPPAMPPTPVPPAQPNPCLAPATSNSTVSPSQHTVIHIPGGNVPQSLGGPRIVQTLQLTPQNNQLLRNIQAQISRLAALPKRNEVEQQAYEKLIFLQQQVIATGTPIPMPSHLSNLGQNGNGNPAVTSILESDAENSCIEASGNKKEETGNSPSDKILIVNQSPVANMPVSVAFVQTKGVQHLRTNCDSGIIKTQNNIDTHKFEHKDVPVPTNSNANSAMSELLNKKDHVASHAVAASNKLETGLTVSNNIHSGANKIGASAVKTVVATSSITSSTSTTNALGPTQPMQFSSGSFMAPKSYTTALSEQARLHERKLEEQKLAALKAEEEKRARWKKEEFEMLLKRDQQYVMEPDYQVPFKCGKDAVERLIKYHVYRDRTEMKFEEFDRDFQEKSCALLDKFSLMIAKYHALLLKESMKEVSCSERVMMERVFVGEEKKKLEEDKAFVAQGELLDLPPPPPCWLPNLKNMVEQEVQKIEQDTIVSQQVQSAVDSIIGCSNSEKMFMASEDYDKVEYDEYGIPIQVNQFGGLSSNSSSADIDEAVRSILT